MFIIYPISFVDIFINRQVDRSVSYVEIQRYFCYSCFRKSKCTFLICFSSSIQLLSMPTSLMILLFSLMNWGFVESSKFEISISFSTGIILFIISFFFANYSWFITNFLSLLRLLIGSFSFYSFSISFLRSYYSCLIFFLFLNKSFFVRQFKRIYFFILFYFW